MDFEACCSHCCACRRTLSPAGERDRVPRGLGCALNFSARRGCAQSSSRAAFSTVPQLGSCDAVLLNILSGAKWQPMLRGKPKIHSWFDKNHNR